MKIDYEMLTDLYQLTMAQGYLECGKADTQACFHMTFRDYPFKGGYAIASGMAHLADLVEGFRFSEDDLASLGSLPAPGGGPLFKPSFIDYLREYAKSRGKTVFLTSHIIQDMERLIDDILIMDYNRVLYQGPLADFQRDFKGFFFEAEGEFDLSGSPEVVNLERLNNHCELYTYATEEEIVALLQSRGVGFVNFRRENLTLEDAFIGLTGKY